MCEVHESSVMSIVGLDYLSDVLVSACYGTQNVLVNFSCLEARTITEKLYEENINFYNILGFCKQKLFSSVKRCSRCGEIRLLSGFYLREVSIDGYMGVCKVCLRKSVQNRRLFGIVLPKVGKLLSGEDLFVEKRCSKCGKTKLLSFFGVSTRTKDGYDTQCKECKNAYGREYRLSGPSFKPDEEVLSKGLKRCSKCNEVKVLLDFSKSSRAPDGLSWWCKSCQNLYQRGWSAKRRELDFSGSCLSSKCCSGCNKLLDVSFFYKSPRNKDGLSTVCIECDRIRNKITYQKLNFSPDLSISKCCTVCGEMKGAILYYACKKNRDGLSSECKDCCNRRRREYFSSNEAAHLRNVVRHRFSKFLKENGLDKSVDKEAAIEFMGCTSTALFAYLEKLFYLNPETGEEMTWNNHSATGWHVDHIISLSSVDLTDPRQLKRVCHYSNLQPLWGKENLRKSAKLPENWDKEAWLREIENGS